MARGSTRRRRRRTFPGSEWSSLEAEGTLDAIDATIDAAIDATFLRLDEHIDFTVNPHA